MWLLLRSDALRVIITRRVGSARSQGLGKIGERIYSVVVVVVVAILGSGGLRRDGSGVGGRWCGVGRRSEKGRQG